MCVCVCFVCLFFNFFFLDLYSYVWICTGLANVFSVFLSLELHVLTNVFFVFLSLNLHVLTNVFSVF